MKGTNNSNDKTLLFPVQIEECSYEESRNLPGSQLVQEVRILLTKKLNRVALGEYELTDADRQRIAKVNAVYANHGLPLIEID